VLGVLWAAFHAPNVSVPTNKQARIEKGMGA
jgi:hypothetical protein